MYLFRYKNNFIYNALCNYRSEQENQVLNLRRNTSGTNSLPDPSLRPHTSLQFKEYTAYT